MTRIRDNRESTSISEYNPGTPWGDLGAGAKVTGVGGFDLPDGDPADGEELIYDAASGTWMYGTPGNSGTGMVPYYIAVDDTFTVPLYKQGLFSDPIEVDGALVVNGVLIGVD